MKYLLGDIGDLYATFLPAVLLNLLQPWVIVTQQGPILPLGSRELAEIDLPVS